MSNYDPDSLLSAISIVTPVTVANTVTTTVCGSVPIPTGFINAVGRTVQARFAGTLSCVDAGHTLAIDVTLGSTTLLAVSAFTPGVVVNTPWVLDVDLTTVAADASGSIEHARALYNHLADSKVYAAVGATSVNLSTEAATSLSLIMTWSVADSGNTITTHQGMASLGGMVA